MGDYSPKPFENVFSAELEEIAKRQGKSSITEVDRKELAGLALSGGGIRSATTSLGVLQALKKLGLLDAFDYLSTVSGGGFTGSWWSAWVSREFDSSATSEEKFFPPNERTQPERDLKEDPFHETNKIISSEETEGRRRVIDPVHHLRLFSNYLTPIKGLLSIDTWRAVTVITRNLGLTWLVLIPVLFAAVLIAQSYFTLQVDSETEFLYPYSHMNEDKILNQKIGHEMQALEAIDKVVHHDSSRSIVVSRIIHVGKQDPSSNVISAGDPLLLVSRDLDSLEKDEAMDSILAKDVSSWKTYIQLKTEIDSMQREVSVWRAADSMTHVQQRASTEKNYDATVSQLYRSLDANVDTIHIRLMQLQAELVKHRWQSRDEWLFNDVHLAYLGNRLALTSYPMIALFGWIAMFVFLWVINGGSKPFGGNVLQGAYAFALGIVIFWGLLWSVPEFFSHRGHIEFRPIPFSIASIAWTVVALIFLNRVIWDEAHWFWKAHRRESSRENQQKLSKLLELRRSRIVQSHERLLLTSFGLLILLGFGGFGHEFINYLVLYHPLHSEETVQWVVRGTSIALALGVLIGSSLVAKKSGPTTDPLDRTSNVRTNKLSGILMKIAPPLLLLMLLCGVSWVSHWVLQEVVFRAEDSANRSLITIVFLTWLFGGVSVYYAIQEIQFRSHERLIRRCLIAYLVIPPIASIGSILSPHPFYTGVAWLSIILFVAVWAIVFWKYRGEQNSLHEEIRHDSSHSPKDHSTIEPPKWRLVSVASITTVMIVAVSVLLLTLGALFLQEARMPFYWPYVAGLSASILVLVCDLIWGVRRPRYGLGGNHEGRLLLGVNVTLCTLFLFVPPLPEDPHLGLTHVLAILIFVALGLVIFIGWRLDPNALSVHSFYRARLVRAYLGASNWMRGRASISEVHPNDDVALTSLQNCERGAPYHLVNTTLNLLGTRSLEAAQRGASNFILSKRYCGSVTTGYQPTDKYMSGEMTLGTAIAISGAAASPNMGSLQMSGATTMLMSLLNIRLGYWAPNPARNRWRETQPKLWPYYLIKESLSHTTGLGAYCYLTDGGHFDNTGIYPLIERGCRYIMVCDNGADPLIHFKDIGNAFRRARIDFGAEFELEGLQQMTGFGTHSKANRSREHWLRGTVTYNQEHLRMLWGEEWDRLSEEEKLHYRTGTILILKPVINGDEPADVLQYSLEFADFPQQSTANQWFTEDQFESYRRLGYWSAQAAFENPDYTKNSREEKLQAIATPVRKPASAPIPTTGQLAYGSAAVPIIEGREIESGA